MEAEASCLWQIGQISVEQIKGALHSTQELRGSAARAQGQFNDSAAGGLEWEG